MGNRGALFDPNVGDRPFNIALTNNYAATTNPGGTNDFSQGYRKGSIWINTATTEAFLCMVDTVGSAVWDIVSSGSSTPGQVVAPAASTPTGAGGVAGLTGGTGGTTSGAGGAASVTGGAAAAGNGNGGSVVLQGGALNGSGANGSIRELGLVMQSQATPVTQSTAATLTAAQVTNGIIISAPAAGIALTMPLATAMDTAIPDAVANDSFSFSVINTAGGANTITMTTNTGWTLTGTGVMTVAQNVSAQFLALKTGAGAWTLYRLS